MSILITHECSGRVREALRALGLNASSCDLKASEDASPHHFQMDALRAIRAYTSSSSAKWDMVGMHCECRYLCGSGIHWNKRRPDRAALTEEAFLHIMACVELATEHAKSWYLENSIGILSSRWRKPDCIVQPYQFGEDASKATCFWLHNLPPLKPTKRVPGRMVEWPRGSGKMVERWSNQTDSGQNRLAPSEARSANRARTYPGIAAAIAEQWGNLAGEGCNAVATGRQPRAERDAPCLQF